MYEAPSDMSKANGLLAEALGVKTFPTLQVRHCQPSLLLPCNIAVQCYYLPCPHSKRLTPHIVAASFVWDRVFIVHPSFYGVRAASCAVASAMYAAQVFGDIKLQKNFPVSEMHHVLCQVLGMLHRSLGT